MILMADRKMLSSITTEKWKSLNAGIKVKRMRHT